MSAAPFLDNGAIPRATWTDSDSDGEPLEPPTPVSIDLEFERAWKESQLDRERKRLYDLERQDDARKAHILWDQWQARDGIYMRTRAGIVRNVNKLRGYDGWFCFLNERGVIAIDEIVEGHISVSGSTED